MAAQQGYLIDKKCKAILLTHFEKCLCSESFGNARYVRKLFELVLYIRGGATDERRDSIRSN